MVTRTRHLPAYAWAAPCSVIGLLLAVCMAAFAKTGWQVVDGVVEVCFSSPRFSKRGILAAWPFAAITLGHVVAGVSAADLARLRAHEHAHVRQYERWGAFLLLAYPAAGAWQLLRGRRAHWDNPFEIEARNAELRVNGP
jgi:hypothetical protein